MSQRTKSKNLLPFVAVELASVSYAIVPTPTFVALCRQAGITAVQQGAESPSPLDLAAPEDFNATHVARRIADRRKRAGLTQGELAHRAGVRIETVNRIERGHVTPDFGTIRKLVEAMQEAESAANVLPNFATNRKE